MGTQGGRGFWASRKCAGDPTARLFAQDFCRTSIYIEAAVSGILVGCLYAPNGNPQPGPKFDRKLNWLEHFVAHAAGLYKSGVPVVLAGDYNIVPTERDIYKTSSYDDDALVQPESRAMYRRLLDQGWTSPASF